MDKSTHMQACISTNKSMAFNIHSKQHYVMENQWIMIDEGKTPYIPGSSSKKKSSLSSLNEFFSPKTPQVKQLTSNVSLCRQELTIYASEKYLLSFFFVLPTISAAATFFLQSVPSRRPAGPPSREISPMAWRS